MILNLYSCSCHYVQNSVGGVTVWLQSDTSRFNIHRTFRPKCKGRWIIHLNCMKIHNEVTVAEGKTKCKDRSNRKPTYLKSCYCLKRIYSQRPTCTGIKHTNTIQTYLKRTDQPLTRAVQQRKQIANKQMGNKVEHSQMVTGWQRNKIK